MFKTEQIILVTGASSGIGRAIATECADSGATVLACGRDEGRLNNARMACSTPERWISIPRDLCQDMTDLPQWLRQLADEHGRIWGMAHCAGAAIMDCLRSYDSETASKLFDLNFNASMLLAKGFADRRVHQKGGAMIFVASVAGVYPEKGHLLYGALKAALIAAVKSISQEVASIGLRANCVSPGIVDTPMQCAAEEVMGECYRAAQLKNYPFGFGQPADVSGMVTFLLSTRARWISGQNFILDGGRY